MSTGGGFEVSSVGGGGGGSHSKKGPKEPEAKLDFFGVEVRAQVGKRHLASGASWQALPTPACSRCAPRLADRRRAAAGCLRSALVRRCAPSGLDGAACGPACSAHAPRGPAHTSRTSLDQPQSCPTSLLDLPSLLTPHPRLLTPALASAGGARHPEAVAAGRAAPVVRPRPPGPALQAVQPGDPCAHTVDAHRGVGPRGGRRAAAGLLAARSGRVGEVRAGARAAGKLPGPRRTLQRCGRPHRRRAASPGRPTSPSTVQ